MAGMTPEGFETKNANDVLDEIATRQRDEISSTWKGRGLSIIGILNSIIASIVAALWAGLAAIYAQFDPASAEGRDLDAINAIRGVTRNLPSFTRVVAECVFYGGTYVQAGELHAASALISTKRFTNTEPVLVLGDPMVQYTKNVVFLCDEIGPIPIAAGELTVIETPVLGWVSITNPDDGDTGSLRENDEDFRLRGEAAIAAPGSATAPAVLSALLRLEAVTYASVIVNDTNATVDTVPAHSIECVVSGADDVDIANAIFNEKDCAGGTFGNTTVNVLAPDGLSHAVRFSRPVVVEIYLRITLQVTPLYPGDTAVVEALLAYARGRYSPGAPVVPQALAGLIFGVPGVVDCAVEARTGAGVFSPAQIPISPRQRAALDATRMAFVFV